MNILMADVLPLRVIFWATGPPTRCPPQDSSKTRSYDSYPGIINWANVMVGEVPRSILTALWKRSQLAVLFPLRRPGLRSFYSKAEGIERSQCVRSWFHWKAIRNAGWDVGKLTSWRFKQCLGFFRTGTIRGNVRTNIGNE